MIFNQVHFLSVDNHLYNSMFHLPTKQTLFTLLVGLFLIYLQHQTVLVSKKAHYSDTYHQLSRSFSLFSLILLGIFLQLTYHFIIFSNFSRFSLLCINFVCHLTLSTIIFKSLLKQKRLHLRNIS